VGVVDAGQNDLSPEIEDFGLGTDQTFDVPAPAHGDYGVTLDCDRFADAETRIDRYYFGVPDD
jgi:hypothetical protein